MIVLEQKISFKGLFKILVLIVFISSTALLLQARAPVRLKLGNTIMASSDSVQLFWLRSNQYGTVRPENNALNITSLSFSGNDRFGKTEQWGYDWGLSLIGALGNTKSYLQANQLYATINWSGWQLQGGRFSDQIKYNGLSTTNGNLARSLNARPYPMLRLSTIDFIPIPFIKKWLTVKAEYDEGILDDKRHVMGTRLHHKSLHVGIRPGNDLTIKVGVEHYVMWGGTSPKPEHGKLPADFKSYLLYISGSTGNSNFPLYDQENVAGNHYGTYQVEIVKTFSACTATFYLSHPFDDFSGVNWRNWPDNLFGIHVQLHDRNSWLTDFVYEYTTTRQQSILGDPFYWVDSTQTWQVREADNYFANGLYQSGVTYHQLVMCSPLFEPEQITNGISYGIRSSRFFSHHLGMMGNINASIRWKTLFTYVKYFGGYHNLFDPPEQHLFSLVNVAYINQKLPFEVGFSLGADIGKSKNRNFGAQLSLVRYW
jgi:hypothetical protein